MSGNKALSDTYPQPPVTEESAGAPDSAREGHVLARVIETMSLEMDFEKICRYATQITMEVLGADLSALALPRADQLRFQYFWGFPPEIDTAALPSISPGTMVAFKSGKIVFVPDYTNYAGALKGFLDVGVRSGFAAPIRLGDKVTGVLTLAWQHHVDMPSDEHVELVEAVLRQIGFAYQREQLMNELSASKAEAVALNDRLQRVLSVSPVVIYNMIYDTATEQRLQTSYLSENIELLLGYPKEWLTDEPHRWYELVHPEDLLSVRLDSHPEALLSGSLDRMYRMRHQAGHYLWVHDSLRLFRTAGSRKIEVVGALMDITERKEADTALQAAEAKYRSLVEQSMIAVYLVQDGRFRYANPKLAEIFGCSQEEVLDAPSVLDFVAEEDHAMVLENLRKRLSGEVKSAQYEFRVRRRDGKLIDVEAHGAGTHVDGKPAVIGMGIDVTARKAAEAELRRHRDHLQELVSEQTVDLTVAKDAAEKAMREAKHAEEQTRYLALNDALTGLPNRVLLLERLHHAIAHVQRRNKQLALLFIDLDRFKNINDSLGHFVGDKLLCEVAKRFIHCVRETDTVSRQGGDEFVILLSEIDSAESVAEIAEKLLAVVAQPYFVDGYELSVTHSIGISVFPDDGDNIEAIMRKADTAMYKAKEAGRNNYQFYTRDMSVAAIGRLALENDLRRALERDEFVLHYQPQIVLDTGRIVGIEALIRWQHPERGLLYPDQFIGLAEDSGLIVPIGRWVLRTACQQNRAWQQRGIAAVPIAVNLSAVQLRRRDFMDDVTEVLRESGLAAEHLNFELTESVLMHGANTTVSLLHTLRQMGIRLSIDDFGTDYSSLSYLKRFPVNTLKIDRTFIADITADADDAAITRAIISMGHSLRLRVIAEGVETREQLEFLRALHCDEAQGNYFGRPLPAAEAEQRLLEAAG
jgi:diguanylate cyclase